mgnify:CR=1 FL=1
MELQSLVDKIRQVESVIDIESADWWRIMGILGRILRDSIGNARQSCDKCIAGLDRIKTIKRKLTKLSFFVLLIFGYPEFRHSLLSPL